MEVIRIENLDDSRLELYTSYNEAQLLHLYEPNGGVFIAETPMVISRALERGANPISFLIEEKAFETDVVQVLLEPYVNTDLPIYVAALSAINKLTGFNLTRGVLAVLERPNLPTYQDILGFPDGIKNKTTVAVLEDVMNPTNVGAIFRSAAALGVDGILLTTNCTDPFYRRAARVSMGTVFQVPWTYLPKNADINQLLHSHGFATASLALRDDAISLTDARLKNENKIAVIFGTESTGIKQSTIDGCDYTVIIPMQNEVDSLNVAAASAVTFWELRGRLFE